jgi:hypothetical protein
VHAVTNGWCKRCQRARNHEVWLKSFAKHTTCTPKTLCQHTHAHTHACMHAHTHHARTVLHPICIPEAKPSGTPMSSSHSLNHMHWPQTMPGHVHARGQALAVLTCEMQNNREVQLMVQTMEMCPDTSTCKLPGCFRLAASTAFIIRGVQNHDTTNRHCTQQNVKQQQHMKASSKFTVCTTQYYMEAHTLTHNGRRIVPEWLV